MKNELLLLAGILSGLCSVLSFRSSPLNKIKKTILIFWCLSAALVVSAAVWMVILQISCKFEYQYVYSHISTDMAPVYKISALWSGQEGSFLLWALIMGIMGFFVLQMQVTRKHYVFGIYSAISFCVYLMCFFVRPFEQMTPLSPDGLGLSEALKDPWMVIHPPLVFISYSAMAVLFSLSTTISKNGGRVSAGRILTWLRISWIFLGLGIFSGSIWAYRALGWGGYWAWDPIENAALVPWLILCGYLHRRKFDEYSVCIVPFSIACFGVFLVRSGILKDQSAHAYTDGNAVITGAILCFILGAILFLTFIKIRKAKNRKNTDRAILSGGRRVFYIINGYAALIFIGTVAPMILNTETPIAYYTAVSSVFTLAYSILLLLGDLEWLKRRSILMIVISTMLLIGIMAFCGSNQLWWLILLWICLMPLSLWLAAGFSRKWNNYLPHLGVLLLMVGAIGSSALGEEAFTIANPGNNQIMIESVVIPLSELSQRDILIKSLPAEDIVIKYSLRSSLANGGALIPYETKPLILLFWIGGFSVIAAPLISILSDRFHKPK